MNVGFWEHYLGYWKPKKFESFAKILLKTRILKILDISFSFSQLVILARMWSLSFLLNLIIAKTLVWNRLKVLHLFIWKKLSNPGEMSHLSKISSESCICQNKSFLWEWIHHTKVRSHLNAGEIWLKLDDFSPCKQFLRAVSPRQDCSFSLDMVCFCNYHVKKCN